ncbi:MAG: hypothetical protein R8M45_00895 [Ghiorsea sp.]
MKLIFKFDTVTKIFLEDVLVYPKEDGTYVIPLDCSEVQPQGFLSAKWNAKTNKWVEVGDKAILAQHAADALFQTNNAKTIEAIHALEATITPRLLREYVAGVQFAVDKMAVVEAEIATLRASIL